MAANNRAITIPTAATVTVMTLMAINAPPNLIQRHHYRGLTLNLQPTCYLFGVLISFTLMMISLRICTTSLPSLNRKLKLQPPG